jgi:hypothetical protein
MDERELRVRASTYRLFVDLGRAPTVKEVAEDAGLGTHETMTSWRVLHDEHALVLSPATGALRMANPFSAVPTPFRVQAGGRSWYANCAWDALGICAALHVDGHIDTTCPDCGAEVTVNVHDEQPDDESLLFHCLLPASRWWDDIVYT